MGQPKTAINIEYNSRRKRSLLQELSFGAWGDRRNSATWRSFTGTPPEPLFDRGFTGHEHLYAFGLINMNGRMYDPLVSRMLSPDNFIQAPDFSQSFNRYSYALNNPLIYTDPTGEFVWVPVIIGAVIGTYMGGTLANEGELNPTKWDYNSGKTWGYMLGGAVVGGLSGYVGGTIATSEIPFANTLGIAGASLTNSVGMYIYTGGQTDISGSLGVASYNFSTGDWGYLGKKENSTLANIGYGFGALANLADVVSVFGGGTNLDVNSADTKKPHEWWGHSSATDQSGNIDISVGPAKNGWTGTKMDYLDPDGGGTYWSNYAGQPGTWTVRVNNVNASLLKNMTSNIAAGKGLYGIGQLKWNIAGFSCVNHVSRALWAVGIPTLPVNLHPLILNTQLFIRQIGIYSSPYLYNY